ncbi:hypothetical protein [Chroococcidiopsis thermalis]|uniref:Uncharacterized protein n=1 Tax=Chroococcidiopsis thermalis (strain PCC 7203) TaxID=251229 RepID=K9U8G0_CHRTP|nr:hypothetical protein [Chroococcidiopsis thermalis]AFY90726.1 hypothetical protein Chro_5361 [Chroococcidiopsis thermalis PCC 7203]
MARYTCSFTVATVADDVEFLRQLLNQVLHSCHLDIQHDESDYMMARERLGQVSFSKLVKVEALIDKTNATNSATRVNLIVKNEELPLQIDNHCYQMFNLVKQAIVDNCQWQLVETAVESI